MARDGMCEACAFYDYDEETDSFFCGADMDEDDMERFLRAAVDSCPFYRPGDEYRSARRQ
jgi:ferredoxin